MSPRVRGSLLWLHRWTGITTGLVLLVVCLSGTALAFSDEYRIWRSPARYTGSGGWPESMSGLIETSKAFAPWGSEPTSVIFAPGGEEPARIFLRAPDGERTRVYLHPDGTPIEWGAGTSRDLMSVMLDIHRQLLGGDAGRMIVDVSTVLFVLILVTGIPIWWPKTWKQLRRGLSVKWKGAKATRRIHDLHVSLGAWSLVLLLAMGVTGVFFAYDDWQDVIYVVTGTEPPPPAPESGLVRDQRADVDAVLAMVREESPNPKSIFFVFASGEDGAMRALVFEEDAPHPSAFDTYYYDQYTGEPLGVMTHASLSRGERVRRVLFPFHTGEWNLATKIIWGFVSFLGATFPITGFLMWFRRKRRAKGRRPSDHAAEGLTAAETVPERRSARPASPPPPREPATAARSG